MSAATYNLFIDQGSDFTVDLVIKENGSAMNLTNYSGRGQLRSTHESTTIAAYFKVTKTNPTGGALKVEIPNGNWTDSGGTTRQGSKDIPAGQYVYDLEIFTNADGVVKRIMQGTATVNPEVTR
jgi:hypothetical protein